MREALTVAIDRARIVAEGLGGYATPLAGLTPPWCNGIFPGAEVRARDAARAKELFDGAGWPEGRPLLLATPMGFAGVAGLIAADVTDALGLEVQVIEVPDEDLTAGARMLVEKKLPPPWDVLLHAWFDLSSDLPPAVVHREFFGHDGAFRAGPEDAEFDALFAELVRQTQPDAATAAAEAVDRYCYEQCKALFLCAPRALYAVNRHVQWEAYRATFELADAEVSGDHWSRRD